MWVRGANEDLVHKDHTSLHRGDDNLVLKFKKVLGGGSHRTRCDLDVGVKEECCQAPFVRFVFHG